ncbi:MAG: ATP-dependent Clp protease proteolytic subunit [Clostridia bacterium]|nr:ATP-dependent Clp protease proteolytic subunit [Clostridia bacterium]
MKDSTLENSLDAQEMIENDGSIIAQGHGEKIHCISIIGQIEGHYALPEGQKATKYEHIVPLLVSVEQSDDIDGLLIILNTMGGDVEAGLAIAELIASMRKPTVSLVLGGGHSIGVPLAVSAKCSFIVPSATMTVHPVRISGTVVGSPQTFYYFEKMQDRISRFVCEHSKISKEKFTSLMMETSQIATDTGSIIDGEEAINCGLIDKMGGLQDALSELSRMIAIYNNEEKNKS